MTLETIEVNKKKEQTSTFQGKLLAKTKDNITEVYETPKGNWVILKNDYNIKKDRNQNVRIFTGYVSDMKVINNKDINELYKYFGFGPELDEICESLGIDNKKKLDI